MINDTIENKKRWIQYESNWLRWIHIEKWNNYQQCMFIFSQHCQWLHRWEYWWKEMPSSEINLQSFSRTTSDNRLTNWKLLKTWLCATGKLLTIIWYKVQGCSAGFNEETINLKGKLALWIFGRPYALGKTSSLVYRPL